MPISRIRHYLCEHDVEFTEHQHERHVPAQEVAEAEHVTGWRVAKPVMLWADGEMLMVVVPAATTVDLDKAAEALGAAQVRLAEEKEFVDRFPDCEAGAEPPFGHLYDVDTYVCTSFPDSGEVVFRAGSHTTSMTVSVADYERLTKARRVDLAGDPPS